MTGYEIWLDKADSISDVDSVPDVHIHVVQELPKISGIRDLPLWDDHCDREAAKLETALRDALPGAVYDRLLGYMLRYKATHFRVPHGGEGRKEESTQSTTK